MYVVRLLKKEIKSGVDKERLSGYRGHEVTGSHHQIDRWVATM